jgi:hypothetical protein
VFVGYHPTLSVPLFTTRCDGGRTWSGSACTGTRTMQYWANSSSSTGLRDTGVDDLADGKANTLALTEAPGGGACTANQPCDSRSSSGVQAHNAAKYCADLDMNGHQDWYLPATMELYLYITNMDVIEDITADEVAYWTSTNAMWDQGADNAMGIDPTTYQEVSRYGKNWDAYVRCMRRD